jgi:hypothetical protein
MKERENVELAGSLAIARRGGRKGASGGLGVVKTGRVEGEEEEKPGGRACSPEKDEHESRGKVSISVGVVQRLERTCQCSREQF